MLVLCYRWLKIELHHPFRKLSLEYKHYWYEEKVEHKVVCSWLTVETRLKQNERQKSWHMSVLHSLQLRLKHSVKVTDRWFLCLHFSQQHLFISSFSASAINLRNDRFRMVTECYIRKWVENRKLRSANSSDLWTHVDTSGRATPRGAVWMEIWTNIQH